MGGANENQLPVWTEFAGRCEEFYVTTEDGSAGEEGRITDLLPGQIARGDLQAVYTCGPRPMMAKVAAICAEANLPCFASLEQWMGLRRRSLPRLRRPGPGVSTTSASAATGRSFPPRPSTGEGIVATVPSPPTPAVQRRPLLRVSGG